MTEATEAVLFNGVPLLLLAAAYAAVTGAVLPLVWRDRARAHPLDWAVVLVFPGVFRGLLDAQSHEVTDDVLFAAANALANIIGEDELNAAYIIPSVFHPDLVKVVAAAVETAARAAMGASTA